MTWKDENIDKLFQEASKEKTFEFKEEYWNELETMLGRKKRRRFPFIWFFSGALICITVISLVISNEEKIDISKNTNQEDKKIEKNALVISTQKNKKENSKEIDSADKHSISKIIISDIRAKKVDKISKNINSVESRSNSNRNNFGINNENGVGDNEIYNSIVSDKNRIIAPIVKIQDPLIKVDLLSFLPIHSSQANQNLLPCPIFKTPIHKYSLYFGVFTNMGQSMIRSNSLGSNITKGLGISAGVSYNSKNWEISSGLSTSFNSYDNLYVKKRVKIYGFGIQNFDNETKYKQLFTLEMPIILGFKKNKHTIQLGIVPSLLVSSKITFESISNSQIYTSCSLYGYRTGLVNFGMKPTVGYMYKLTPSLQIGGNVQVQVISQIEDGIYEGVQNSLPLNGQLFIRKSITLR